ncbi:MAG: hypothetical protein ACPGSN_01400 [Psychrobium sp.]
MRLRVCSLFLMAMLIVSIQQVSAAQYLKLSNNLDRPKDGYCLDVQGVVGHFRADKPIVAHNCKRGVAADGLVRFANEEFILFPAFGWCLTAMGTANTVLPGTSLMIKPCEEQGLFASSDIHKRFKFNKQNQLKLSNFDLCLVVGGESAPTFSAADRWRTLFLDTCSTAPLARSQWEFKTIQ